MIFDRPCGYVLGLYKHVWFNQACYAILTSQNTETLQVTRLSYYMFQTMNNNSADQLSAPPPSLSNPVPGIPPV